MAMVLAAGHSAPVLKILSDGWTVLKGNVERLRKRRLRYRQIVHELDPCSDRELTDIGIARTDIRRLARESAAGN